jgi:glycosyltransferase involved in cell wall biosynthesis
VKILTGLDLPWGSPGGSAELLHDLYGLPGGGLPADTFMLTPHGPPPAPCTSLPALLDVPGKQLSGPEFWAYVERLAVELKRHFPSGHDVIHLQHLAFGATPALLRAFPRHPHIALVHGTDLLFAEDFPTQARVLRQAAAAARAIVVPTQAMGDHLRRLASVGPARIHHIPWGVPDHLLRSPPTRPPRDGGPLRVLYAGRLSAEKGAVELADLLDGVDGVALSMAAPVDEFTALVEQGRLRGVRHLGWLDRVALWAAFAEHDLLVVPSARLEAFGLVTVEAQACGLPVAYQPVPGLTEVLGDTGLRIDFAGPPGAVHAAFTRLCKDPTELDGFRAAGYRNAARFPLSRTIRELSALSESVL